MHTYTHTYTHTHIHTHTIHTYIHTYIHTHTYITHAHGETINTVRWDSWMRQYWALVKNEHSSTELWCQCTSDDVMQWSWKCLLPDLKCVQNITWLRTFNHCTDVCTLNRLALTLVTHNDINPVATVMVPWSRNGINPVATVMVPWSHNDVNLILWLCYLNPIASWWHYLNPVMCYLNHAMILA